jgi:hypothetical protein
LILFWAWWILILITQAIKLWKYVKYSELKKLKVYGKCIKWKIFEIKKSWKWFLRDDTMRYQIFAQSDETWEKYKSKKTRFDVPHYLENGDGILIYIDAGDPKKYFVDIESAFKI